LAIAASSGFLLLERLAAPIAPGGAPIALDRAGAGAGVPIVDEFRNFGVDLVQPQADLAGVLDVFGRWLPIGGEARAFLALLTLLARRFFLFFLYQSVSFGFFLFFLLCILFSVSVLWSFGRNGARNGRVTVPVTLLSTGVCGVRDVCFILAFFPIMRGYQSLIVVQKAGRNQRRQD
jgi:hypothetical protein